VGRSDTFVDAIRNGDPQALQAVDRLLYDMRHIDDITDRELEVLALMSRGLTYAETGRVLYVEPSTIKSSLKSTRAKLGARNVTHAVAIALREGMIR
jgi:DNA-binding CsgD family transcriptional regulator